MSIEWLNEYLCSCYSDEGERLTQLFCLAFDRANDQIDPCDNLDMVPTILLTGDSGTGKTMVVEMLAKAYNVNMVKASLGVLAAQHQGQIAKGLERLLWNIKDEAGLLLIEDIDLFCPAKGQDSSVLSVLLSALERRQSTNNSKSAVIATCRDPSNMAKSARYLFQEEIRFQIPTPEERLAIFKYLAQQVPQLDENIDIALLSAQAHAFVAADLARWCRLAEELALRENDSVSQLHFERTRHEIRVAAAHAYMAERPEVVRWNDIGGLQEAKQVLEESVVWIYKHKDAYKRLGVRPSKGVLLYGPPGTGKTLLAKAVATESSANFIPVSIPDIVKGEVGESEKAVVSIFQTAKRCSPCVIFLDELEAIFSSRETSGDVGKKLISQFLIEIDNLDETEQSVILLGATNHPDAIDTSILRPGRCTTLVAETGLYKKELIFSQIGRLDRMVYVGRPSQEERLEILKVLGRKTKFSKDVDMPLVAAQTQDFTGADLKALMRKAGLLALKRRQLASDRDQNQTLCIEQRDILNAIPFITPSSSV